MPQNTRMLLAVALSVLIVSLWQEYYVRPNTPVLQKPVVSQITPPVVVSKEVIHDRKEILQDSVRKHERITFKNAEISGSIDLRGAKIDDLSLIKYHQTLDPKSENVVLLAPAATNTPHFITFGWITHDSDLILPNNHTLWHTDGKQLTTNTPVTLSWSNPQGIIFKIKLTLDDKYLFTAEQSVSNHHHQQITLKPYATISRGRNGDKNENMIVHQGPIAVSNGQLKEITFEDLIKDGKLDFKDKISWAGFSDKYWLSTLIPSTSNAQARFTSHILHGSTRLQADLSYADSVISSGQTFSISTNIFVGAKNLDFLEYYEKSLALPLFDHAVDFGKLYFITKPIFLLLHSFYDYIGNFGIAILLLTVFIKLLLFPIAYKGYVGMNRLRDLQPHMAALKERYKEDAQGFQKALVDLYKREKVNPVAGCLPILMQMPVFFALYKVLYVTIEMRQAAFFGWIKDLSAPDPTSIFNLFGLIPWDPPSFLMIGIFPILMSLTMFIQQRLNPQPTDPAQAQIMKMLPLIFLFMFASFPSGMVIYWAWSNLLSIIQQVLIKKLAA